MRGWDAQYYYACARSLVFDTDLDITNDLEATPHPAPFDRDADGQFEAVPRDRKGRIVSKYPIGLSLVEVPFRRRRRLPGPLRMPHDEHARATAVHPALPLRRARFLAIVKRFPRAI